MKYQIPDDVAADRDFLRVCGSGEANDDIFNGIDYDGLDAALVRYIKLASHTPGTVMSIPSIFRLYEARKAECLERMAADAEEARISRLRADLHALGVAFKDAVVQVVDSRIDGRATRGTRA